MGKKGDATKQHIRAVASGLFAEYGYTQVTMQDICEKTGLSKGGLYRHYEDKSQLFTDILRALQKEEADKRALRMEQGLSAREILDSYLNHMGQHLRETTPSISMALYEFCMENKDGPGPGIISEQFQRGKAELLSLLEYGISKGEFEVTDPQGAVSTILFLMEGLRMVNEVMPIPAATANEVLNQVKEIVGLNHEKQQKTSAAAHFGNLFSL